MSSKFTLLLVMLLLPAVAGHTDSPAADHEEEKDQSGLLALMATIAIVSLTIVAGVIYLRRMETVPGSLPIRSIAIAATLTLVVNAVLLAFIYVEF